jgi:quinol monooxygenase YgiN
MVQPPDKPSQQPARGYVYVWEFKVAPEREQEFLAAYGPSGAWSSLFQKAAAGYVETLLLQDQSVPGRFVTVDRWHSQDAHEAFLAKFRAEYEALDLACEPLTQHEASLGSYWELIRGLTPQSRGLACGQPLTSNVRPRNEPSVRDQSFHL